MKLFKYDSDLEQYLINIDVLLEKLFDKNTDYDKLLESNEVDLWDKAEIAGSILSLNENLREVSHDNSYNYSSDFSSDIDFMILSDSDEWYYSENTIVIIGIHQGGDVRGNYSKAGIYTPSSNESLQYFLDYYCGIELCGLEGEPVEICEYTTGYQREPQYHFNNDFNVLNVNPDGSLLVENKETTIGYIAWPQHGAEYC